MRPAPSPPDFGQLAAIARELRIDVLRMLEKSASGHPGGSLGMADVYTTLWFGGWLRTDPSRPDWEDHDRVYDEAGLLPPRDHTPVLEDWMVYADGGGAEGGDPDDRGRAGGAASGQAGYTTSFMYSPVLQRHIAIARVRPDLAEPGTPVKLEFTVNHHYEQVAAQVARLPLFDPERRTA